MKKVMMSQYTVAVLVMMKDAGMKYAMNARLEQTNLSITGKVAGFAHRVGNPMSMQIIKQVVKKKETGNRNAPNVMGLVKFLLKKINLIRRGERRGYLQMKLDTGTKPVGDAMVPVLSTNCERVGVLHNPKNYTLLGCSWRIAKSLVVVAPLRIVVTAVNVGSAPPIGLMDQDLSVRYVNERGIE